MYYEVTEKGLSFLDSLVEKFQDEEWTGLGVPSSLGIPRRTLDKYWLLSDIISYGRPTGDLTPTKAKLVSKLLREDLIEESGEPRKFYHGTSTRNLESILREGLKPEAFGGGLTRQIPPKKLLGGKRAGIYLEPGWGAWAGERRHEIPVQVGLYGSISERVEEAPAVILEVDLPDDVPIVRDPGSPGGGGAKALKTIEPKYIEVLEVKPEELR